MGLHFSKMRFHINFFHLTLLKADLTSFDNLMALNCAAPFLVQNAILSHSTGAGKLAPWTTVTLQH